MGRQLGDRVVVLGGSMAGLNAARVLSESYSEVTIVDRDRLVGENGPRRGVPQAFHAHALLARGQHGLDDLFPGFTEELVAAGKPMVDMGEMQWYLDGQRLRPARTGLLAISLTRPALEAHVRNRLVATRNVTFLEGKDILGLRTSPDGDRVTGVRIRSKRNQDAARDGEEVLSADLVVDATGRGSRIPAWLAELGYKRPAEERVVIGLAYTTCEFILPSRPLENDWSYIPLATPANPRGAFFGRVNGDRHILSLTSMLGDHPSTDLEGVLTCAKSLPIPYIYEAIRDVEPAAGPVKITFPASVRRRYERLARFPDRLLVMGDAVCSFNPVYGQGMTVAVLEALTLRQHLQQGRPPQARRFFRDIARIVDGAWAIAAGGDLAWPGVEGRRTLMSRIMNRYMGRLMYGMVHDGRITEAFMRVAGLIDPPQKLLRPATVLRVLRHSRQRLAAPPAPSSAA